MIFNVEVMAAFFANPVAQAPVIVQCAQAAPEQTWKWWFGALAPWVGPILSTIGSIYVAWRVFRWQGKKDREQWLLDQKKAEWRELLDAIHVNEPHIVRLGLPQEPTLENVDMVKWVHKVTHLFQSRLFIDDSLILPMLSRWNDAYGKAKKGQRGDILARDEADSEFRTLINEIRENARIDLRVKSRTKLPTNKTRTP
jgi:hypothetical protein